MQFCRIMRLNFADEYFACGGGRGDGGGGGMSLKWHLFKCLSKIPSDIPETKGLIPEMKSRK